MKSGLLQGYQRYYAGFSSRMLAFFVDTVILVLTFVILSWFISVSIRILPVARIFGFSLSKLLGPEGTAQLLSFNTFIAVATFSTILYYVFFWTIIGQTLGMVLLGLRVVTVEGRRLTVWRALLRFIGYMIAALPFFLGFAWILVDDRRQGWHDKLARTYVAYTWAARPDERFLVSAVESTEEKRTTKEA